MLSVFKEKNKVGTVGARLHYEDNTIQHDGIVIYIKPDKGLNPLITHSGLRNYYNYSTTTKEVIGNLQLTNTTTKLLAIIANERGATDAVLYDEISYLGFPFSVSQTFQKRNTNSSIEESLNRVEEIQNLCIKNKKELVVYISMGFGNPYGDVYNEEIVFNWVHKLVAMDIKTISLADTVGIATPTQVQMFIKQLIQTLPQIQIGVHLHSTTTNWKDKVNAALEAGCLRFDGALKGIGGCPMADDELVGNMDTELMIPYFKQLNLLKPLNEEALAHASKLATEIFI